MRDLIKRLRSDGTDGCCGNSLCGEAAAEIERLRNALIFIRDTAYSPQRDDVIWIDDQTPLGQFIDMKLSAADRGLEVD